jgi:endoglucanase
MRKIISFFIAVSFFGIISAQEFIRVNQIGYYSESPKTAMLANLNAMNFQIRKVNTEEEVYEGKLQSGRFWNQSNETIQIADFSDFKTPGKYFLQSGTEKSYPFEIKKDNVFDTLSIWSIKAFYLWRASTGIELPYATFRNVSYARKAGHPDDMVYIHKSVANEKRPAETIVSAPKGWYDAGDYNKYVVNSGITVHSLMTAYEMFPDYYKKLNLDIPESGDSVPDILNELKWNFDWLLEMQDPLDGGVYNKLTSLGFSAMVLPDEDHSDRYMVGKSTTAALDFAAIMAMAARVYKEYEDAFPGFSEKALTAAEKAWSWALKNNNIAFKNPPDVRTGGYSDSEFEDEFFWAASELLITTGNKKYYNELNFFQKFDTSWWQNVGSLGLISMRNHLNKLPDFVEKETIVRKFKSLAENVYNHYRFSPNLVPVKKFEWGSNGIIAMNGVILGTAYFQLKDEKYLSGMVSTLNYLLGTNPTEYCFVTHFGSKYPRHIHDRRNEGGKYKEPLPGYLVGGSNPDNTSDCNGRSNYPSSAPARCYLDDVCSYSTNEIAINWNAPFALLVGMVENAFDE